MIDSKNVRKLLDDLAKALSAQGETRVLTIFGSGALLLQGLAGRSRATVDIDVVDPKIDVALQIICGDVGEKYGLSLSWLNSAGLIFSRNFPKGWKERAHIVYQGDGLTIKSLGRRDLVATKFSAACGRAQKTDFDDLVALNPTGGELDFSSDWMMELDNSKELKESVQNTKLKLSELIYEFKKAGDDGQS